MKKLSIRKRGGMSYEIGPSSGDGKGPVVMVSAKSKKEALAKGRSLWKDKYDTRATRLRGGSREEKTANLQEGLNKKVV